MHLPHKSSIVSRHLPNNEHREKRRQTNIDREKGEKGIRECIGRHAQIKCAPVQLGAHGACTCNENLC